MRKANQQKTNLFFFLSYNLPQQLETCLFIAVAVVFLLCFKQINGNCNQKDPAIPAAVLDRQELGVPLHRQALEEADGHPAGLESYRSRRLASGDARGSSRQLLAYIPFKNQQNTNSSKSLGFNPN